MLNLNLATPKCTSLRETASQEPSCVKIGFVVFPVEDGKKKGKKGYQKSRKRYISPIRGEALRERIFTKFCTSGDMPELIICANFDVEKLRGLGYTGSNFGFSHWNGYRAACDKLQSTTYLYQLFKQ